ncbi:hypothetical protein J6I90_01015 [Pseudidiomarina sp. 1APP75-32.1]|uniref:HNH endonuclease n=1 Tax=Pseudidiomarina terrestris TaxID=2820060 RepID=A0AAW7QWK0_9GAMM|nr:MULTISPECIES: hypothetical protein [unclassified Pseudidiomarina]MDN7123458.1 hypothetical protein [Pseudidiomarina sp. 1APP75-32.1]MDN7128817.1 hypothetical protein [Pseudidiomarina sp. 1APR75-15]
MAVHPQMKAQFFATIGKQFNRCLSADMTCERTAIRAHSVQNAGALDLICLDGHVICPMIRARGDGTPEIDFIPVGRNKATTFTGLCSEHDSEIFREIDRSPIDVTNPRHLYLLAKRSILRELHATMDGASKIQSAYLKRVELGLDPKDRASPAAIEAMSHLLKAWRTYRYRCKLDRVQGHLGHLKSHIRILPTDKARLAASIFFGIGDCKGDEDIVGTFVNVVPLSSAQTAVAISYLDEHSEHCDPFFAELFRSDDEKFKAKLSAIVIRKAENFAISPEYFESWPKDMKDRLREVFVRTLFNGEAGEIDGILLL